MKQFLIDGSLVVGWVVVTALLSYLHGVHGRIRIKRARLARERLKIDESRKRETFRYEDQEWIAELERENSQLERFYRNR
jgi:hypothetical protein